MLRRAVVTYLRPLLRSYTHTVRHGLAKGLTRKGGFGFIPFVPLTAEEQFLLSLDFEGQTVYDVGAWEGVITLFFSRAVGTDGRIVAFEPHPETYQRVLENLRLNAADNVELRQVAVGATGGTAILISDQAVSGEATARTAKRQRRRGRGERRFEVEMDSLDNHIRTHRLPKPDFVKIDVEGLELEVVRGMEQTIQQHRPRLFVEIHDFMLPTDARIARRLVEGLAAAGYSVYHVEAGEMLAASSPVIPERGHLYCS
jgi:FkbM family methyltransferase